MGLRPLIVGTASILVAVPALSAEPAKAPVQKAEQRSDAPAPVMVAAVADTIVASPAEGQPQAKPVRHARVTSCRCGNPAPTTEPSKR